MKIRLCSALMVSAAAVAFSSPVFANDDKPFNVAAADNWQSFDFASVSEDEQWTAQYIGPSSSLAELLEKDREAALKLYPHLEESKDRLFCTAIQLTQGNKKHEICAAGKMSDAKFSEDGQWFGVLREIIKKEDGAESEGEEEPETELVLLNLQSGDQTVFRKVATFEFAAGRVFVHTQGGESELSAMVLATQRFTPLGKADSYSLSRSKTHIAWTKSSKDGVGNGVYLSATDQPAITQLDGGSLQYSGLKWSDTGDALLVSRSAYRDDVGKQEQSDTDTGASIFTATGVRSGTIATTIIDQNTPGFLAGKVISDGSAQWSEDQSAILMSFSDPLTKAQRERLSGEEAPSTEAGEQGGQGSNARDNGMQKEVPPGFARPNLALWHWQQANIPNQESQTNEQPSIRYYPGIFWLAEGKLVPLMRESDPRDLSVVDFTEHGVGAGKRHLLATHQLAELQGVLEGYVSGPGPVDVFLVDVKTGSRQQILQQVDVLMPEISPNGRFVTYFEDGHHHIYDIAERTSHNLTERTGRDFLSHLDDNFEGLPAQAPKWTKSGGLLLEDNFDIWFVANPENGITEPVNLTLDGVDRQIDYSVVSIQTIDAMSQINSEIPIFANDRLVEDRPLVHAQENRTLNAGFARIAETGTGLEWVRPLSEKYLQGGSNFYAIQSYESSNGVRLIFQEQDLASRSVYVADAQIQNSRLLFSDDWNSTAFRRQYAKPAGVRIVNYSCTWGKELTGSLILPHNYRAGQKYPMITIMYEWGRGGTAIEARETFSAGISGTNPVDLASLGYAVLLADVAFQPRNPGISSTQCLMPAVDAAIATGIVDEKRMGIHGHSWGGYQTLFTTTQTNRFAAAIAGAGLTDLISMWGGVYWGNLYAQHSIIEKSQGRMIDTIWDNWEGYLQNSPLYHARNMQTPLVILHNDKDSAVGFYQGHEYFLAMRRLQKPAVMLQYRGEDHGLSMRANRIDYRQRSLEFWNHFLTGEAAPDWWSHAIKPFDMEEHINGRFPALDAEEGSEREGASQ